MGAGVVRAGRPRSFVASFAPGLATLLTYRRAWLRGDVVAGLTVGALLITQCMAYAPIAGLPPSAAFHAVVVGIPIYALLGSSRHLAIGPDPGTASLAAAGLATVAVAGTPEYVTAAAALAVLVGVVLFAASLLRLGFVASLLSRPALVGYLSGLGVSLFVSQLGKLTGAPVAADGTLARVGEFLRGLDRLDTPTLVMGIAVLVMILVVRARSPRTPGALVGVVLALAVTWLAGLDAHGIRIVGDIDAGLGTPGWPSLPAGDWGALLGTAAGIALVGYADSILTARGVAEHHGDRLDPNRELSGLGVANGIAGLVQGMPLSSTGSGTAAMSAAGGRTSLAGIIAAGFVASGLVAFPGVLERIPQPALAAVVAAAAINLVELGELRDIARVSKVELLVALVTAAGVVFFDVLVGVLVSVALSGGVALARVSRPHDSILGDAAELDGWVDADAHPEAMVEPGLLVYRFDAPLFFTNATRYRERVLLAMERQPGDERWVVLDLEGVGSIDSTAIAELRRLVVDVDERGVRTVAIARANHVAIDRLRRAGLLAPEGPIVEFPTINAAVRAFRHSG